MKVYHHNIGGIFQGEEKFIEVVAKADYDTMQQRLTRLEAVVRPLLKDVLEWMQIQTEAWRDSDAGPSTVSYFGGTDDDAALMKRVEETLKCLTGSGS